MQTDEKNKRWGATAAHYGGEDTWQEMTTARGTTRTDTACTVHEEKVKGGEMATEKQKNGAVVKANNCNNIDSNKPVSIVFYLSFERPTAHAYATHKQNMNYEVQAKQFNTRKFANICVTYIQAIFYTLTE